MLKGKTIVLGVSGGVAAYKALPLCSRLTKAGANVDVIMTSNAMEFVQPLAFQSLSRRQVYTNTFIENDPSLIAHIDVADRADLVVIAPATANVIGKMANGIADDMLTTVLLATSAPVWVAPAMNVHMLAHPAVQHNLQVLASRGVRVIDPAEGELACGYTGKGRLPEPDDLFALIEAYFSDDEATAALAGKKIIVTAGGTRERFDPVRYFGNDSSGKMGHAIAEAAKDAGMEVTLVTTSSLPSSPDMMRIDVESAQQMYEAVMARAPHVDIVVKAAAVADYRPINKRDQKMKKSDDKLVIELERTVDILQELGNMDERERPFLVGFAAETENIHAHALAKIAKKNCDLLVVNDVTEKGAGFGTDTNIVHIYDREGIVEQIPLMSKQLIAERLLQMIADYLNHLQRGRKG